SVQPCGPDCHVAKNPRGMQLCGFEDAIVASSFRPPGRYLAGFSLGLRGHQPGTRRIRKIDGSIAKMVPMDCQRQAWPDAPLSGPVGTVTQGVSGSALAAALRTLRSRSFCAILISRPRSTGW